MKNKKTLIVGIVAAVAILAVVLCLLLVRCDGDTQPAATSAPETTQAQTVDATLYWNVDRALYDGKSEAGMSSRMPEEDGLFHIRFFVDGEIITLKALDRKVVNALEVQSLMGLEFDEDGYITEVIGVDDMPVKKIAWQFYVQSFGGKTLKLNSSSSMNGLELLLEGTDNTHIYDMTGSEGEVGTEIKPIQLDRVYAIGNMDGELTHVFVYDRPNFMLTHEDECIHCGKTVTWSEWTKEDALPVHAGHYQLQNDVQLKSQASQLEDAKICLDLNGKRVDGPKDARVYSMHNAGAELAIMDTSAEQTGVMAAHGTSAQGLVVWIRYGQFYLYSGTLDASDAIATKGGTAVAMSKDRYFYMNGGTIIGGTSLTQYNATTKKYSYGIGGSLYMSGGKFVMRGGEIRDGYAKAIISARNADGSPKTYQQGKGGNIYASGGAVIEMYGGVIRNGRVDNGGANFYLSGGAELLLDGGQIVGGVNIGKGRNGGSIYITATSRLTMYSGSITGGTCYNGGGNIYSSGLIYMAGGYIGGGRIRNYTTGKVVEDAAHRNIFNVNGIFRMYGGKIDGGVCATDSSATDNKTCFVGLTTHAVIDGGENSNNNLTLSLGAGGPVIVNVDKLLDDARIRVNAATGIFTTPTIEGNADKFISDVPGADIVYYDGCIGLGKMDCLCGQDTHVGKCDGTDRFWAPLTATTNLKSGGNYYLTKDMSTSQLSLGAGIVSALDLNGYTLTASDSNVFLVNGSGAHLDLTDHAGGGKVVGKGFANGSQGGTVYVREGSMDIYGGTLTGTEDMHKAGHAGILSVRGTVNMYGGTVTGGKADQGGNISVTSNGVLNIYGGTVTGGTADSGSNIYVSGKALTLAGGKIDGGIRLEGTPALTISGSPTVTGSNGGLDIPSGMMATVSDLSSSASICVKAGGYFAQVNNGSVGSCFSHVRSELDVAQDGNRLFVGRMGCICGNTTHVGGCTGAIVPWTPLLNIESLTVTGNYYLIEDMTCGQISPKDGVVISLDLNGHTLTATSGRVFMPYETTTLNICDSAGGGKLLGKAYAPGKEAQGGVIYVRAGSVMNLYGGTIGTAAGYGAANHGGIISVRGTLNMYGGSVVGGKSTLYGGTISVTTASGIFNLYGGTVSGGTAPMGGNVYVETGKVNISGGSADNVFATKGSSLSISGGETQKVTVSGITLKLSGVPMIGELIPETDASGNKPVVTAAAALTEGASITVTDLLPDGVFSDNTLGAYAAFFRSKDPNRGVYGIDNPIYGDEVGKLYLGKYHCLCGKEPHVGSCDGKAIKWTALTDTASLKTGGSFYLTGDVSSAQISLGKGIVTNLDLNGHAYIASVSNAFLVNGDASTRLVLCDSAGGGTLQGRGFATANQGGAVYIRAGNMDIYGGTICKAKNYQVTNHGGLISVRGTLHMYDGTIEGGTSQEYGGNVSVSASGIFYLHGGTITGGSAPKGGNICVTSSAKLYIQGGKVENGIASESGGNVYVDKQNTVVFEMTGGELLGGTATVSGGNLFVLDAVGTKSVTGGKVTGGTAPTGSCAYVAAGTLTVGPDAVIEKLN